VLASMVRATQSGSSDHAYLLTSQIRPHFSNVSDTVSRSESFTRTSSALPSTVLSSVVTTEVPGRNPLTLAVSSGSVPSRVSQPSDFQF